MQGFSWRRFSASLMRQLSWFDRTLAVTLLIVAIVKNVMGVGPGSVAKLVLALAVTALVFRAPLPSSIKPTGIAVVGMVFSYGAPLVYQAPTPQSWAASGVYFLAAGIYYSALVAWAFLSLGRSFAIFPTFRPIVGGGPYCLVRHPMYAAYAHLTGCYVALAPSLLNAVAAAFFIGGLILRTIAEERLLGASEQYLQMEDRVPHRFLSVAYTVPATAVIALSVATRLSS